MSGDPFAYSVLLVWRSGMQVLCHVEQARPFAYDRQRYMIRLVEARLVLDPDVLDPRRPFPSLGCVVALHGRNAG